MSTATYLIHPLEVADSLLSDHPAWCAGAAQLAALTLCGPWYQLEYTVAGISQCVPYPPGPTRKTLWVRAVSDGVRVKVTPKLKDPGPWLLPAPYLRRIFHQVAELSLPAHVCATRVVGHRGPSGVRIRVCLDDPASGHHEALFESRPHEGDQP